MRIFAPLLILTGLFVGSLSSAIAAKAETEVIVTTPEFDPTGLLWKEGRVPFVLERFLKDEHMQAKACLTVPAYPRWLRAFRCATNL